MGLSYPVFRAFYNGDIAQWESVRFASERPWVRIPLSPFASVAQWIEHRIPVPGARVRLLPDAFLPFRIAVSKGLLFRQDSHSLRVFDFSGGETDEEKDLSVGEGRGHDKRGLFQLNNFREWLSDNLRYILLILGIIAVLAALFFGIRFLSKNHSSGTSSQEYSSDSVIEAEDISDDLSSSAEADLTEAVTPTATVKPTVTPEEKEDSSSKETSEEEEESSEASSEPESAESDPEALKTDAYSDVNALITAYYNGLQNRDVEAVRSTVDTLSEEDAASVTGSPAVAYSDITVYTKPGYDDDSLVVYAYYHYSTEGASALPGLSRLYLIKNDDGAYRITTGQPDAEVTTYLDAVNDSADVKALVERVQTEYDSAVG